MLRIKSLTIKSGVIQSPMAGCTDLAFRLLAREYGMEFCFLEMVAAESLIRGNEETAEIMKTLGEDKPLGAQLVGCRPAAMAEAAKIVEDLGYDLLDLNLGCPVPKVTGKGAGSALLARPEEAKEIFEAVVGSVKTIPVTVKMRLGVEDASGEEAIRIAKIAEQSGVSAVTVHGRTRVQGYSGEADYNAIAKVKAAVKIPVIGNGDITTAADAERMKSVTNCDGLMIGRGGLGNPWIYRAIERGLQGDKTIIEPGFEEKKKTLLKHLDLELAHRGEKETLLCMRRVACWYFKNVPGVGDFRTKINVCASIEALRTLIGEFMPLELAGNL